MQMDGRDIIEVYAALVRSAAYGDREVYGHGK